MRWRIFLSMAVVALVAVTGCTRKHSLYIDPGKKDPKPAAHR